MTNDDVMFDENYSVLEDAFKMVEHGEYEIAAAMLEKYLQSSPGDIDAIHLMGATQAKMGNIDRAESLFKKELEINPNRPDAFYNLGLIHIQQNRIAEAINDYENVIKLKPADNQALNDLGVLYMSQGDKVNGERLLSQALKSDPTYKDAFLNLFEILWKQNRYNEAVEHVYDFLTALVPQSASQQPPVDSNPTVEQPAPSITIKHKAPAIIKLSQSEKLDIFEKHVPESLRAKKTGMNMAIIADFNIAGQLTQLFRLINEKTIHRARCIIVHDDYLSYDKDLVLSDNKPDDFETALKIIENADFYHIGRFPVKIGDLDLADYLRPDNAVIQYFGSDLRNDGFNIYNWHKSNRIVGLSAWDYTMLKDSPFFYHINMMFDASRVKRAPYPEGTLKIVHPTTNRNIKKTELFLNTIDRLRREGCDIEPVLIEHKTNQECLDLKSQAHLTYDQISVGIYGVSAIESMAAGHVVFGGISNFAASYHPDNPIVWVTENSLAQRIKYFVEHREQIPDRGQAGIDWVKMHHDPMKILCQHLYMYDFIKHGHRFLEESDAQLMR
ncbi:MAG: tetratricopeptide repeat protein [candidate division Zixibacteria bacterium]|nr:tetratricopeptide repeat protein [candidate division Zixibacteria bacterium]